MARGGVAWRGWFPVGRRADLGHGRPQGGHLLRQRGPDRPVARSRARTSSRPSRSTWRATLLDYLDALTALGQRLVAAIEVGLGVAPGALTDLTADPLVLFRIFHYPPGEPGWGVGEHTDYGLLTILRQDDAGGLQVEVGGELDRRATDRRTSFVCNIGDMLERATSGAYRSTPHRVRNESGRDRVSMPFFLDPGWDGTGDAARRRTGAGRPIAGTTPIPHLFDGTYGEYVMSKVSKVFPAPSATRSSTAPDPCEDLDRRT